MDRLFTWVALPVAAIAAFLVVIGDALGALGLVAGALACLYLAGRLR